MLQYFKSLFCTNFKNMFSFTKIKIILTLIIGFLFLISYSLVFMMAGDASGLGPWSGSIPPSYHPVLYIFNPSGQLLDDIRLNPSFNFLLFSGVISSIIHLVSFVFEFIYVYVLVSLFFKIRNYFKK